jgi:hypothetical protein
LQTWLETCPEESAQLKARLQFRRAHQLGKPTFKQASPKEYDFNCGDSEVKRKFTNLAIGFSFSGRNGDAYEKEWSPTWLETCLDELAQFKARLQFRRAHQLGKPTFNQASPKEYDFNCADSEVKRKFTNLAIGFSFSGRNGDAYEKTS